jgi:hypothetical protein
MSETTTVNAQFSGATYPEKFKFNFKKTKLGQKRPSVEITHSVLSLQGIKEILELDPAVPENKAQQDLLLESTNSIFRSQISSFVSEDELNTQAKFDPKGFTWAAIANMPKQDRQSSAIPAEVWEAFGADYATVMGTVAKKDPEALKNAVLVYTKKFAPVKTNKPALKFLQGQLALYLEHSEKAEEFMEIVEMLVNKADALINDKSPEDLIANLGM